MAKKSTKSQTEIVEDQNVDPIAEEQMGEEGAPINLSLQDLNGLLTIVDLASSRGAFRGAELTQVGAVYDKLFAFLKAVQESQNPEEGEDAPDVAGE